MIFGLKVSKEVLTSHNKSWRSLKVAREFFPNSIIERFDFEVLPIFQKYLPLIFLVT